MREIYLLSEMSHNKNVVNLIGFKKDDEKMHIFMEYVEGGSIESQIKKYNSPIKEKLAAKYTFQILKGLRFLHEKGVIHGDLKCMPFLIKVATFSLTVKAIASWQTLAAPRR
jgi:serine/threonine protein kinase